MIVARRNKMNGKVNEMELDVTHEQLQAWQKGELIQRVMGHLNTEEREFLITGMSIEEQRAFEAMMGEEE